MINKKTSLLIIMFLLSIGLVAGANFFETFESYAEGDVDTVTSFWNCSSFADTRCSVVNNTAIQGSKSVFIENKPVGGELRYMFTNSFSPISSGIVNFWIAVNHSSSSRYTVGLFNESSSTISSTKSLANINSIGGSIFVGNGTTQTSWVHGVGQSFIGFNNVVFYWRIRVNFDTDTIEYFQYDENLTLRTKHQNVVGIPNDVTVKVIEVYVNGGGSSYSIFVDDIQLTTGNTKPVVSNLLLTPASPEFTDVMSCTFDFFDLNNDADESTIVWKVNNIAQTLYENSQFLAGGVANPSDTVTCEVTANDGIEDGNTISASVSVQGVVSVDIDVTNFTMVNTDFKILDMTLITALDYFDDESSPLFAGEIYFGGNNGTDFVIGVVDLADATHISASTFVESDFGYVAGISAYDSGFWVARDGGIQRWNNAQVLNFANNVPLNFTSSGEIYLDVKAINDTTVLACSEFAGAENLVSFIINSSGDIEDLDLINVPACRDIEYADGIAYVDMGMSGLGVFNVSNLTNIVSLRNHSTRVAYAYNVRHDTLDLSSTALLMDAGEDYAIEYLISNLPTVDLPFVSGLCEISEDDNNGQFVGNEIVDDDLIVFSNLIDDDIYVCEYAEQKVQKIFENPSSIILGRDLVAWTEANLNYIYTSFDNTIQLFLLTTFDQNVNQLPEFVDATPDNQFIDNLNPISTNVTPAGLETPVVNVFPLTCLNPNIFDCSNDFEGDTILFAVDKENDGNLDIQFTSVENIFVTYDTGGLKTLRIYITDDQHVNNLQTFRDFTINVSSSPVSLLAGSGLLKFLVKDSITGLVLSGVSVSINNVTSGFTNGQGEFNTVVSEDVYLVQFGLNNYVTKANYFSTSPLTREVFLEPVLDSNKRTLTVIVKDINNTLLSNIFVNLFMPITQTFDFKVTDALGTVTFTPPENNVVLTVEKNGFSKVEETLSVLLGTQIVVEVVLEKAKNVSRGSTCVDYLAGVITCGEENKSCTQDSDCINDLCAYNGKCSNFNWTLCDDAGVDRGQRCVIKYTSGGVFNAVGQWLLANFFFVLIMVFLALAVLIFALSRKN